ncbi:hypothetical protein A2797_02020 [candidate division WWE3 bacterium RIFCSPHIGHO2_01_FULL_48_15]|uniref:LVIVD repeat protein n=1 Tax=candidate division WWE3 bacterium RIFCSPHIGHO2_01_FULL_48_15 TaxID=1802619 RepID=A0A1F4VFX5_UNCKA|nr:MAG: hypothetical protein A2797_02020 [candidate division WWE3 bacterium RIFCSPHIGHO2_01_FULL_48_15]
MNRLKAFTVIEIILAMGLFTIVVGAAVGVVIQAFSTNRLSEEESYANGRASEGIEAARAIATQDFFNLVNGSYGLTTQDGRWEFSGSSETLGKFTRRIIISNVFRDAQGNIVSTEGSLDLFTKRVESLVNWDFSPGRSNSVSLKTYFTFWEAPICEWEDASSLNQVGGLNLPGPAGGTDIAVDDNVGYATGIKNSQGQEFFVLSLADPVNPQVAASVEINFDVNAVWVSDSFAYLATSKPDQELMVFNVSDPNSPVLVGGNGAAGADALDVTAENSYAYLGLRNNSGPEFYIYNVAIPSNPTLLGTFEVGKDVSAISVKNDRAYLAVTSTGQTDAKSLLVLDVSDPAASFELGSYQTELAGAKGLSVFYAGGIVHLTTAANAGSVPEYYLLDASDPTNINLLGSLDAQHAINSVETGTGFALLATDTNAKAVMIVDIAPPTTPTEIFSLPLGGSGIGTAINGCYAYVSSTDNNQEIKVVAPPQ